MIGDNRQGKMQFKIPKFGFKSKKRGNAAGFFGAKLSFISNHLSIISNKLSQNNHLSIINDKLSKKRINYKLSIFGKKLIINYKLLIAVGVLALAATGGTLALNGFFGGGAAIPEDTMTRGLAGYWSFDEGGGAIARDASGNNNHGTLTNGPKWAQGKNGSALQFDGKDDYVEAPDSDSLDITNAITIEAWIYDKGGTSDREIVQKNGEYLFRINRESEGGLLSCFVYLNDSWEPRVTATQLIPLNTWAHVTCAWENSTGQLKLYINGKFNNARPSRQGSVSSTLNSLYIGSALHSNGFIVDDLRVYNRALTEAEVKYHYNRGGPVAQWDMDEGGGSVINDKSGNGNDGTIFGATWAQGKRGSALSFDGVDDYVNAGNGQSMDITDKITLSAWVNPSSWGSSDFPRIIVKETGVSVNSYALYVRKDNSLLTFVSGGNLTTTETIPFNQWTHITAIYDSAGGTNNRKIYFNGRLVAQNTGTSQINSTAYNVFIGNGPDNSRQWDGLIDEVKIYDYARTEEEIRLDYNAGVATHLGPSGKTCSEDPAGCMDFGLAGHWDMDEGNGSILNDKSGNNNHGTLANGPKWAQGKHGTALQFDGKDDYVDAGNGSSLNMGANQDFSIEAWVKYSNNPSYHIIAGKYCDINTAGYWLDVLGNRIRLRVGDGGGSYVDTVTTSNYNDNKWHHIMAIADRDGLAYIYIDGNQVKSNDISSENGDTGSEALSIGWPTDSNYAYFNGQIDEVKIYNRALSAEEVRYHYNQGKPVAQWDMDEGSGLVINDKSGNGNNGTLVNDTTWAQGKHGSALSFDGVDDYVSVPNSSDLDITADESFSYSLWLKTTSTGCASCHFLIKYGSDGYSLHINGGGIRALVNDSDEQIVSPSYQINDGIWHYVEVVFDRSTDYMTLYVDGTSRSRTNVATIGSLSNPQPLYLMHFSTIYFAGLIDEVKIYDYARTEEEIRLDYNAGLATHLGPSGKTCSEDPAGCMDYGLAGHWDMDEGNGSIINDKSGNNNSCSLVNGPVWSKGKTGSALYFDGENDYADCNVAVDDISSVAGTVELWAKADSGVGYPFHSNANTRTYIYL